MSLPHPYPPLFPYTTLFRSLEIESSRLVPVINPRDRRAFEVERLEQRRFAVGDRIQFRDRDRALDVANGTIGTIKRLDQDRKSTRLNSSHITISYAVFCLKK